MQLNLNLFISINGNKGIKVIKKKKSHLVMRKKDMCGKI